jgi:hypothetical protein
MVIKKDLHNERGCTKSDTMHHMYGNKKYVLPLKPLETLSNELSEMYGKKVVVEDVLEEHASSRQVHSLITGKTFDEFLNDYEFNTSEFTRIEVDTLHGINKEKNRMEIYSISIVYRDVKK